MGHRREPDGGEAAAAIAALACLAALGCGCGQRGNDGWTGYSPTFDLDGSWEMEVLAEGKAARRFHYLTLDREGDRLDGWRCSGIAEGTTHQDLQLSFTMDWGRGNRVTIAGKATPHSSADPNNYLGGTFIEYEEGALKQEGDWWGVRNKRFGRLTLAGTFLGKPLSVDTQEGRGETWSVSLKESEVAITHGDLTRRVELVIGIKSGQAAGDYPVVEQTPAPGQVRASLRVDEEGAERSPDPVAATGGKVTLQSFVEHVLTGSVELTFPGGDKIQGSFSELPTR